MKINKIRISFVVGSALFAFAAVLLANYHLEKVYRPGEYVKAEDAYFVEEIVDPTGLIKAEKYTVPTDNQYSKQKTRSLGADLIGDIESVWANHTGEGTTIAVIDDGFDYNHPEYTRSDGTSAILQTSRYYYVSGNRVLYKSFSTDPTSIEQFWSTEYHEWDSHGTATSTTAAAPMNNSGGVGIAPEADILALKIDFNFASIEAAIKYAIQQDVDVINMSLGAFAETFTDGFGDEQDWSPGVATYLEDACQEAYDAGIIVVAAAGNEATWHKSYPACNAHVIGVGAIGDYVNKGNANQLADFTNFVLPSQTGEINVDILAPGYVYTAHQSGTSSKPTHGYADTQGTSFSSPIIAGAAALWKEKYPSGTPSEFLSQLQSSADGIGFYEDKMVPVSEYGPSYEDAGPSNITNGRLNVAKLLDTNTPYVTVKQSSLNITEGEEKQITLTTANGTITYSSNNSSIATVSNSGLVKGVSAGLTSIVVTATKEGKTADATVEVIVAPIVATSSLTFNPSSVTLNVGETYNAEETIVVTPSNASRIFLFESTNESVVTVDIDTGLVSAVGTGTALINAIAIHTVGNDWEDSLLITVNNAIPKNGVINFANVSSDLNIKTTSASGIDSLNNPWVVTTVGTSTYFGNSSDYAQIGSGNDPASTIEFKMILPSSVSFTSVIASFGGFNDSFANVSISVGETQIGTGSISGTIDRTTTNSSNASGTTLIIYLSGIRKGIKAYSISYTYIDGGAVVPPTLQSVDVKNTKTYHPGQTISKSDISVTLNYSDGTKPTTTDFTFASEGYMFTYEDASSGGANTSKQFSITYKDTLYNFSVNVTRSLYQASPGVTTTLSSSQFNSSNLSKDIAIPSIPNVTIGGVSFTVTTNAYVFKENSTNTHYLSFGKVAGAINNKDAFSSDLTSVTIVQKSGARRDGILSISKNGTTWVEYSTGEIAKGNYRYFKYSYVGSVSGSGASTYSNIQSISYTLSGQDSATSVANYVMYEDTANQCVTKLSLAIEKLNTMSSANKNSFWTSNDFVIATARERLLAWARHEGRELTFINDSFIISGTNGGSPSIYNGESQQSPLIISVMVLSGLVITSGLIFLKRKRNHN